MVQSPVSSRSLSNHRIIALMLGSLGMGVDEAIESYRLILDHVNAGSANDNGGAALQERSNALRNELKKGVSSVSGNSDTLLLKNGAEPRSCKTWVHSLNASVCYFIVFRFVCTRNEHNFNANTPVILRSYDSVHSVPKDCKIWEAGLATSATPGIFDSVRIGTLGPFVSGAWGCSNPTQVLLEEAAQEFPGRKIASVISIGTGHPKTISLTKSTLTDVAMQIAKDCEGVHERMLHLFANHKTVYHRFNVEQGLQMTDLDLLTDSAEVEAHTHAYLSSAAVQLALPVLANLFVQAVGKVDPSHLRKSSFRLMPVHLTYSSLRTTVLTQRESFAHPTPTTFASIHWAKGNARRHQSISSTHDKPRPTCWTETIRPLRSWRLREDTSSS